MKDKKLQFKFKLQEVSYGKIHKHVLIWECPSDVDDIDSADDYLSHNMSDLMTKYDWGNVLDFKVLKVGYDLGKMVVKKVRKEKKSVEPKKTILVQTGKKSENGDMHYQLQQQVFDYFEAFDDKTIVAFIESFSYHRPAKKEGIGKVIEKFLKDNGLEKAYVNYVSDITNPSIIFRASMSERSMIEDIKNALFNLAFNRLRNRV